MRKNDKYKHLSEQERLTIVIANYRRPYLFWKGQSLYAYCKENDYSYNSVYNYIIQSMNNDSGLSYPEVVERALSIIKRYGVKYYYKGVPLIEYCKAHGLRVDYVRRKILFILHLQTRD